MYLSVLHLEDVCVSLPVLMCVSLYVYLCLCSSTIYFRSSTSCCASNLSPLLLLLSSPLLSSCSSYSSPSPPPLPPPDINECEDDSVCVDGECLNTDGTYMCFCTHPMVLDPQGNHCIFPPDVAGRTHTLHTHCIHTTHKLHTCYTHAT